MQTTLKPPLNIDLCNVMTTALHAQRYAANRQLRAVRGEGFKRMCRHERDTLRI
jgi:hypothetical protein